MPLLTKAAILMYGVAVVLGACTATARTGGGPSREAFTAYNKGMRAFQAITPDRSDLPPGHTPEKEGDYGSVERLFTRAAELGLPHGDYGLACAIYASGNRDRYLDAFSHAAKAARAGVFEAQVLLVAYHNWSIGIQSSNAATERARETAYASLSGKSWPMQSGVPGTVSIAGRYEAEALAKKILEDGKCGPATARLTPMVEIDATLERARELPGEVTLPIRRYVPAASESNRIKTIPAGHMD